MTILRYSRAAYLIWMGVKLWTGEPVVPELQPSSEQRDRLAVFATGVARNLGNPKLPLFCVAQLPNVVGSHTAAPMPVPMTTSVAYRKPFD